MFGHTLYIFHITQLLKIVWAEECMKFFCWGVPCNKNYYVNITHYNCILVKKPATEIKICELHYIYFPSMTIKESWRRHACTWYYFSIFLLQPVSHILHFWHTIFWENTRSVIVHGLSPLKCLLIQRQVLSWIKVFLLSGTCKYKNCLRCFNSHTEPSLDHNDHLYP